MDDAEQRFDELLRCAVEHGPQFIERDGEEIVVVISPDEYRRWRMQRADG
jgi:prevent-host-death family protein